MPLLAVAFVLGALFPAGAVATGDTNNSGPGLGRGGDDETIGTLPIVGNHGQHLELVRHVRDVRPDFYLEGAYDELLATIIGFTGSGQVSYEPLPGGHVRLGFHGQLEVQLDRGLLQVTGIQVGTSVPEGYRAAQAWTGFAGQARSLRLHAGDFSLPVSTLDSLGLLDQAPWVLGAQSRAHGSFLLHAFSDAGILYLGQNY